MEGDKGECKTRLSRVGVLGWRESLSWPEMNSKDSKETCDGVCKQLVVGAQMHQRWQKEEKSRR